LAFSYWIDIPWFCTEGKLAAIFIKPSLGVSNWPVIYFINYTPISSLALFITTPSTSFLAPLRGRKKEDFCKGSFACTSFTLFSVLLYFIFACIVLSKIQKK
jgi:hypothetical protein